MNPYPFSTVIRIQDLGSEQASRRQAGVDQGVLMNFVRHHCRVRRGFFFDAIRGLNLEEERDLRRHYRSGSDG